MSKKLFSKAEFEKISKVISAALQSRPVIHLHIAIRPEQVQDTEQLALTIARALKEFQSAPDQEELPHSDLTG